MKKRVVTIPPDMEPVRIDQFLAAQEGVITRGIAQKLIKNGHVRMDGKPILKPSIHVTPGAKLAYEIPAPESAVPVARSLPLEILYEDDAIIAVNKPPHLVVHPAPGHADDTLVNALLAHTSRLASLGGPNRPGIVHRLDKGTSGVVIVAKTDVAYLSLAAQFKDREIKKVYHALVYGRMDAETGTIDGAITRSGRDRKKMALTRVPGGGREAVTGWKVMKEFPGMSLLKLIPRTGRTHQLRVHLASVGHPIVGDPVYGRRKFPTSGVLAPLARDVKALGRQALHAIHLTFRHPGTGAKMTLTAPYPTDMEDLLKKLEKRFD